MRVRINRWRWRALAAVENRKRRGRRGADRGDDLAPRRRLDGSDRHGDHLRLAAGEAEKPGQDLFAVLGGKHLRDLYDRRKAKPPLPEGLLDLRDPLDELGRGLPVLGGAGRQPQLPSQEAEEARVAEIAPQLLIVEVGKSEKEIGRSCGGARRAGS